MTMIENTIREQKLETGKTYLAGERDGKTVVVPAPSLMGHDYYELSKAGQTKRLRKALFPEIFIAFSVVDFFDKDIDEDLEILLTEQYPGTYGYADGYLFPVEEIHESEIAYAMAGQIFVSRYAPHYSPKSVSNRIEKDLLQERVYTLSAYSPEGYHIESYGGTFEKAPAFMERLGDGCIFVSRWELIRDYARASYHIEKYLIFGNYRHGDRVEFRMEPRDGLPARVAPCVWGWGDIAVCRFDPPNYFYLRGCKCVIEQFLMGGYILRIYENSTLRCEITTPTVRAAKKFAEWFLGMVTLIEDPELSAEEIDALVEVA